MRKLLAPLALLAAAASVDAATIGYTQSTETAWPSLGPVAYATATVGQNTGPQVRWRTSTGNDDNDIGALFQAQATGTAQTITVRVVNTTTSMIINDSSKPMVVDLFSASVGTVSPGVYPTVTYTSVETDTVTLTSGPHASGTSYGPGFLTLDVADLGWNLVSGQWYAFLIGMNEEVATDTIRLDANGAGTDDMTFEIRREKDFGATRPYGTTDDILSTGGARDLMFQVTVPEPGMLGVLGIGALALVRRRRA